MNYFHMFLIYKQEFTKYYPGGKEIYICMKLLEAFRALSTRGDQTRLKISVSGIIYVKQVDRF